ncbi:hypothetical protein [Pseudomonas fluorescens]|uniref:hypothetical protein n=1 Tax=Pseudomonas fluorescens TaxID=294 RepID=UPI003D19796B
MAKIKVLAGDFLHGVGAYESGVVSIETALYPWPGINVLVTDIKHINVVNQTPITLTHGCAGMGLAAAMAIAPTWSVTDTAMARADAEVTFWIELRDGRKMLCLTDIDTYRHLEAGCSRPTSGYEQEET